MKQNKNGSISRADIRLSNFQSPQFHFVVSTGVLIVTPQNRKICKKKVRKNYFYSLTGKKNETGKTNSSHIYIYL